MGQVGLDSSDVPIPQLDESALEESDEHTLALPPAPVAPVPFAFSRGSASGPARIADASPVPPPVPSARQSTPPMPRPTPLPPEGKTRESVYPKPNRLSNPPPRALAKSKAQDVKTTFERFEVKYWLPEPVAALFVEFAKPYLAASPFNAAGSFQRNTSLYLDTPTFKFFHDHIEGIPSRIKLRVRGYGDPPRGLAFFEVKRKVKTVTLKTRATLPISRVRDVLRGRADPRECKAHERAHLGTFVSLARFHRAEPVVVIGAYREAFASRLPGEEVRVTLDREIAYQRPRGWELTCDPKLWRPITPIGRRRSAGLGWALLELKFLGTPPVWMGEIVSRFGLQREAFSKYTSAIQLLGGAT